MGLRMGPEVETLEIKNFNVWFGIVEKLMPRLTPRSKNMFTSLNTQDGTMKLLFFLEIYRL